MSKYEILELAHKNCYNVPTKGKSKTMTDQELRHNQWAVKHAIAQQRLEGITIPPETMNDLQSIARGEITPEDALKRAYDRFPNVQVLTPR